MNELLAKVWFNTKRNPSDWKMQSLAFYSAELVVDGITKWYADFLCISDLEKRLPVSYREQFLHPMSWVKSAMSEIKAKGEDQRYLIAPLRIRGNTDKENRYDRFGYAVLNETGKKEWEILLHISEDKQFHIPLKSTPINERGRNSADLYGYGDL